MCIGDELNTVAGSVEHQSTAAFTVAALTTVRIGELRKGLPGRVK